MNLPRPSLFAVQIVCFLAILLLPPQVPAGQIPASGKRDTVAQSAQAAAAPQKVYVVETSDLPASAVEKLLLEASEFQMGSVVLVSKVADADVVIEVGRDPRRGYIFEYQFRLWSLPSEVLVASGKVSEPDETKATTHLGQEIVKALRAVQESPKPAAKPKGPPTPGEVQGYVLKARQSLAKEKNVPEQQIRAVGEPLLAPRHDGVRWTPPPQDWDNLALDSGRASKALVKLDAGLADKICGPYRALIWDDRVHILDSMGSDDIKEALPVTDDECRRVTQELDRFYDVAMQVERGPERFLPFLASRIVTDLGHTEGEHKASNKDKRQLLALYLDWRILLTVTYFEGLREPEPEEPSPEEDEMADPVKVLGPLVQTLRNTLSKSGALNPVHLSPIRPYLREVAAWGPVNKCPFKDDQADEDETLRMPTHGSSYHLRSGEIYFYWIWESGRLKLFAALCQA